MRTIVALFTLALSASSILAAGWEKEPKDFKGLQFGVATAADIEKVANQVDCDGQSSMLRGARACTGMISIGEVPVRAMLVLDTDGTLALVMFTAPTARWQYIRDAFEVKYGAPTSATQTAVKNRAGAEFVNDMLLWDGQNLRIDMDRYGISLDVMSVHYETKAFMQKVEAESKAKAAKAAGDL